jgi:hypothetical protein
MWKGISKAFEKVKGSTGGPLGSSAKLVGVDKAGNTYYEIPNDRPGSKSSNIENSCGFSWI